MRNTRSRSRILDRGTAKQITRSLLFSLRNHSDSLRRIAQTVRLIKQVSHVKRDYHRIKRLQLPKIRLQQIVIPKQVVVAAIQKQQIEQKLKQQLKSEPQPIQVKEPLSLQAKSDVVVKLIQQNPNLDLVKVQQVVNTMPILGDGVNPAPPPTTQIQKLVANQVDGTQTAQIKSDIV